MAENTLDEKGKTSTNLQFSIGGIDLTKFVLSRKSCPLSGYRYLEKNLQKLVKRKRKGRED